MGQKQSQVGTNTRSYAKMCDTFSYKPVTSYRTELTYNANFQNDNYYYNNENNDSNFREHQKTSCISTLYATSLIKTPYWGICMMTFIDGKCPEPRIGQCCNYDKATDSLIVAYGMNNANQYFNDIWALSLINNKYQWRLIAKNLPNPRSYASSTLIGRKMFIFGGNHDNHYYDDLISINIDSGEITSYQEKGEIKPSARTLPVFFSLDHHIYLFGGDDGRSNGGIYRLKINSNHDINKGSSIEWHKSAKGEIDLKSPAFCLHNGNAYIFNGGKENPLMMFDRKKKKLQPICCTGVEPSASLRYASLVSVDEFIFLIGGEDDTKYMHIFAIDIKRKWWFAFNVRPDNKTLMLSDGIINKNGHFMLPREHSASTVYSSKQREIISVMGSKLLEPTPIFRLQVGDALSVLHLRSDMLDIMNVKF